MWTNWNDATRIGRRVYNRIRFLSARAAAFPLVFVLIGFVVQPPAALASEDYLREIKPIFQKRCYACHGALVQESALRIDTAASLLQGGDSGPAIVANSSAGSLLVERIRSTDDGFRMPPEGPPLTEQEIATIARWIDAGAPAPADEPPQPDPRSHWSFQPPTKSRLPVELSKSRGNAIDAFIDREHNRLGLQPLPPADKATLLRRVTLDLIGIPPSREELRAFLANNSPDAYERTVDRLLQRPEYGQRWGRHWMDVWRYSDWYGRRSVPDVMNSYPHIWRWRDWMVDALNEDIGYDEMVRQMLAADELYPGDDSKVVATGFLVRNWFKWNYESWMKDNVEHTGKAFLGLTFNCAHCHHHKYDPISQEDYFKLRAFFEPLELRQDRVPGLPDPGPFQKYVYTVAYGPIQAGLIRVFDEKLDAQTFFYTGGDARNRVMGSPSMVPGVPPFLRAEELTVVPVELPPEAYYPGLREFIRREEFAKIQNEVDIARAARDAARAACDEADKQYTMVVTAVQQPDGSKAANRDSLLSTEQARFDARCEVRIKRPISPRVKLVNVHSSLALPLTTPNTGHSAQPENWPKPPVPRKNRPPTNWRASIKSRRNGI
jgi:mono/diheme cytochrome c family protein